MRRWLFVTALAILPCAPVLAWAQAPAASGEQPQKIQLTQEHIQILQQVVQQMSEEQRTVLAQLPPEQRQQILLQILARILQPPRPEVKEWLEEDKDKTILFEEAERYPDAAERVVEFIRKETDRKVEVTALAFLHDGHDHFFNYKRLFRVKYKTPKDDKEYVADFLFQKEGPYLKVKEWRRVEDQTAKAAG